jgi:hypothetical protein
MLRRLVDLVPRIVTSASRCDAENGTGRTGVAQTQSRRLTPKVSK